MNPVGTYQLESFVIEQADGTRADWGRNMRGLLIYTSSGHVSVSINRDIEILESGDPQDVLDSMLFYAGTYQIHGNEIHHHVTIASNPDRIGKTLTRSLSFDSQLLTLTSPFESFGRAIVQWRKYELV